jgi:hypothetical protein
MGAGMKTAVFWVVESCNLVEVYWRFRGTCCVRYQGDCPDDGGSKYLWNIGKLLPDYTMLQPRRQPSSTLSLFTMFVWSLINYTCRLIGLLRNLLHCLPRQNGEFFSILNKTPLPFWSLFPKYSFILCMCQTWSVSNTRTEIWKHNAEELREWMLTTLANTCQTKPDSQLCNKGILQLQIM